MDVAHITLLYPGESSQGLTHTEAMQQLLFPGPLEPHQWRSCHDSDLEAMMRHMEQVLEGELSVAEAVPEEGQCVPMGPPVINSTMAETRIQRMTESVSRRLGLTVFQRVYNYLKGARERQEDEGSIRQALSSLVERPSDGFEVDQLLYYEEQLQGAREGAREVDQKSHIPDWQMNGNPD
eukprot:XP_014005118.1 PREDICTED: serine/threonine-protein kinase Nek11-like [Salmo salar]